MNPNQALWEKGDFTEIASMMRTSGAALVESLAIQPPIRVLDLGCGDGTTAVPLAQAGADVLGVDIASNLVAAGNRRATEAGLTHLRFQQGDACDLTGTPDASFDLVLSMFGAMFAPKPINVANEMVRVTRPGGQIIMGNWIPNDPTSFVSQLLKVSAAFTPPPPEGFVSPMLWGVESEIVARFTAAGIPPDNITMKRDTWFFSSEKEPSAVVDAFRRFYGPTMNAFEAAEKNGEHHELHRQLNDLAIAQNSSAGNGTSISATFMRVTVQR